MDKTERAGLLADWRERIGDRSIPEIEHEAGVSLAFTIPELLEDIDAAEERATALEEAISRAVEVLDGLASLVRASNCELTGDGHELLAQQLRAALAGERAREGEES